MKAIRTMLMLVLVLGVCLWVGGAEALRSAASDPRPVDAASQSAVTALVTLPADRAVLAVPPGFASSRGYRPGLSNGMLVDPRGGCSSPVALPKSFTVGCQRHDLGYDLLRHAALVGHPLPGSARRAIDDQLGTSLRAACSPGRGQEALTVAARLRCTAWAEVATAAVRVNSWRQGWAAPGRESVASIAEGTGAVGAASAASVLLVGAAGTARRRRTTRDAAVQLSARVAARMARSRTWHLAPRVSTTTTASLAAYASFFPGFLPRSALLQGLATLVFVLPSLGIVRRLRRADAHLSRRTGGAVAVVAMALLGPVLWWADTQQDAQRIAAGVTPGGIRHWVVAAAIVVGAILVGHGLRQLVRLRRHVWRPAVAVGAMAALMAPAAPAHATAPTVTSDRVLMASSPLGAVRAYAAQRPHESLHERAGRVADDLVARGGLTKSRVVVMVPTATWPSSGCSTPRRRAGWRSSSSAPRRSRALESSRQPWLTGSTNCAWPSDPNCTSMARASASWPGRRC